MRGNEHITINNFRFKRRIHSDKNDDRFGIKS